MQLLVSDQYVQFSHSLLREAGAEQDLHSARHAVQQRERHHEHVPGLLSDRVRVKELEACSWCFSTCKKSTLVGVPLADRPGYQACESSNACPVFRKSFDIARALPALACKIMDILLNEPVEEE